MENALRTATGGSRRTTLRPELPSWLASIRRAKVAAWKALSAEERARSAEALKEWCEKRERERRERERARHESVHSTEN